MIPGRFLAYASLLISAILVRRHIQWTSQRLQEHTRHLRQFNERDNPNSEKKARKAHVVQRVKGQLGNHLHILAMGHILKRMALKMDVPLDIKLHCYNGGETSSRINETKNDIKTCFSSFEDVDFFEFDNPRKKQRLQRTKQIYGNHPNIGPEIKNETEGDKILKNKMSLWAKFKASHIPHVRLGAFSPPYLIDRYYDDLITLFEFNYDKCCDAVPDPDETVVHIRGFYTEVKGEMALIKYGYEELSPSQMANEMLGHLTAGDKVALVAPSIEITLPYKLDLEKRGIEVRSVSQSRILDFCFLTKTTKELVAQHTSTYAFWAAILSKSLKKVSLYHVQNPFYTESLHYYDWKHPRLKEMFNYPAFVNTGDGVYSTTEPPIATDQDNLA